MRIENQSGIVKANWAKVYLSDRETHTIAGENVVAFQTDTKQIIEKMPSGSVVHFCGFPFVVELSSMNVVAPPTEIIVPTA